MSLRDYYAGQAMQGILASLPPETHVQGRALQIAEAAFAVADAMITERVQ
jgi:hypothetical protein